MSHTSTKAKTTTKVPGPFVVEVTFAQIKPAKINLPLFGRLLIHVAKAKYDIYVIYKL